jgi:hypothetical protein
MRRIAWPDVALPETMTGLRLSAADRQTSLMVDRS